MAKYGISSPASFSNDAHLTSWAKQDHSFSPSEAKQGNFHKPSLAFHSLANVFPYYGRVSSCVRWGRTPKGCLHDLTLTDGLQLPFFTIKHTIVIAQALFF